MAVIRTTKFNIYDYIPIRYLMVYQGVTIVSPLSQPQALFRPANPLSAVD